VLMPSVWFTMVVILPENAAALSVQTIIGVA
jgi:hypothetical protein